MSSWNKSATTANTEGDDVVHEFIGKLVQDNELPVEQIPDNEYAELQRVGFMRGVVKDFTKIIEDNLGKNEAQKLSNLARRFFVNQEFDMNSRSFEVLKSYLDLID